MPQSDVPNQARRFPPLEVGQRIPDELFGNVPAVTPQVERRIRVTAAAFAVLATALIWFADLQRGPGVQTISLFITVMLCLAAATGAGIRIVRLQRLAIDRLRCGQYPNGRDTPPDRSVGRRKVLAWSVAFLAGSLLVQALSGDLSAWPWSAEAIIFRLLGGVWAHRDFRCNSDAGLAGVSNQPISRRKGYPDISVRRFASRVWSVPRPSSVPA